MSIGPLQDGECVNAAFTACTTLFLPSFCFCVEYNEPSAKSPPEPIVK